jgi:hypothetical protein
MDTPNSLTATNLFNLPGLSGANPTPLLTADSMLLGINQSYPYNQQLALQSPVDCNPLSMITGDPIVPTSTGISHPNFLITPFTTNFTRDSLFVAAGNTYSIKDYDALLNPGVTTLTLSKAVAISQIQDFFNRLDRFEQAKIAFGQDLERATIDQVIDDWQANGHQHPVIC